MGAKDFKKMRLERGYSQAEVARELDVHVMTVSRWERGEIPIPKMAELALKALAQKTRKERR